MPDFQSIEEYADYLDGLSLKELNSISFSIDRERFPERYALVLDRIKIKSEEISEEQESQPRTTVNLPPGVTFIRRTYFAFIVLVITGSIISLSSEETDINMIEVLIMLGAFTCIYFGLLRVKSWVVILLLLTAYLGLANTFLIFMSSSEISLIDFVVERVTGLAFAIFCAYQIYIFSKGDTRSFFKQRGTDLI